MTASRRCLALALALAGCSYGEARELSAIECSDTEDNDGDDLMNCDDPDCQAHAHCAAFASHPIRDPFPPPRWRDARVSEPEDASAAPPADAANVPDEDGGAPGPAQPDAASTPCDGLCDPSKCVDDMCGDPRAPGSSAFELRILAVEVPDFDESGVCLDVCPNSLLPPFGLCACAPDPFVEVWRERGEGEQRSLMLVGSTSVAANERAPNFMDDAIPIELVAGDALEFVLKDEDAGGRPDEPVYSCRPDLGALAPGPLACSARVFSFLPPYSINAELRPPP